MSISFTRTGVRYQQKRGGENSLNRYSGIIREQGNVKIKHKTSSKFLSKGQWTHGPTLCLSIDTHIYRVLKSRRLYKN